MPSLLMLLMPGAQQPPPPPQQHLPGFLRIGINWRQVFNDFDRYIIEPCDTLVTRDEYGLTVEGVRASMTCYL